MGEPLMRFKSHIGGQNAEVTVYPDRVEWVRGRSWLAPAIVAICTVGISLLYYRGKRRSTEMFLTRSISSVVTKPFVTQTAVAVTVSGNVLESRCSAARRSSTSLTCLHIRARHRSIRDRAGGCTAVGVALLDVERKDGAVLPAPTEGRRSDSSPTAAGPQTAVSSRAGTNCATVPTTLRSRSWPATRWRLPTASLWTTSPDPTLRRRRSKSSLRTWFASASWRTPQETEALASASHCRSGGICRRRLVRGRHR